MEPVRFFKSLEEFFFDLMSFVAFAPVSFVKALNPKWVLEYVPCQFQLEKNERFKNTVCPLYLWLVFVSVPFIPFVWQYFNFFYPEEWVRGIIENCRKKTEVRIFFTMIIPFTMPFTFAILTQIFSSKGYTRTEFREKIYIQCYLCTPLQFFFLIGPMIDEAVFGGEMTTTFVSMIPAFLYSGWFLYCELYVIQNSLKTHWVLSAVMVIFFLLLSLLMAYFFPLFCAVMLGVTGS